MRGRQTLNANQRSVLKLIERSPDIGDGWRRVSGVCWPLLDQLPDALVEREPNPNGGVGGRCRLTGTAQDLLLYAL